MKRLIFALIGVVFTCSSFAYAPTGNILQSPMFKTKRHGVSASKNKNFSHQILSENAKYKLREKLYQVKPEDRLPDYERLTYDVRWLGLKVGEAILELKGLENVEGENAYRIELTAKTSGFFSIFPVKDQFISYMDADEMKVIKQELSRREGDYKKDAVVKFDHHQNKAFFKHLLNHSEEIIDIPEDVQDSLTAIYYLRSQPLDIGYDYDLQVYVDEKNYNVYGQIQEIDQVKLPKLGKVDSLILKPLAVHDSEDVPEGKVKIFVSNESSLVPLRMEIKAPLFSKVTITLKDIEQRFEDV